MELKGEIRSQVELSDLFQIISMGKKTGGVKLKNGGELISLFTEKGRIVSFSSNVPIIKSLFDRVLSSNLSFWEAIKFILHYVDMWGRADFLFKEGSLDNVKKVGDVDTLNVMMEYIKELDELSHLNYKDLLKERRLYTLSEEAEIPITFDKTSWIILVNIVKGNPILDVIFEKAPSFKEGVERVDELIRKSVLEERIEEVEEKEEVEQGGKGEVVPEEKIEEIRNLLTELMGPMGEFLIDETLEELQVSELPYSMVDEFTESLVEKIPETCLVEGESCKERLRSEIKNIIQGG